MQERFEVGLDRSGFASDGVGLFDLAEDLRLANDHAVERAGDAEEMTDGFALTELIKVRLDIAGWDGEVLLEEAEEVSFGFARGLSGRFRGLVLKGEEFDAVAGGEDEAFADAGLVQERERGVGETTCGDGEAFADLDGRGVVIDADEDEAARLGLHWIAHGAVNLWTAEN